MRTRELARLISTLGKLPREQRYAVATELASMQSRASSIDVIEAEAPARPECPHCASSHTIKHGRYGDLQRFRCRHCNRTFNTLTGTPLAHLHLRNKWLGQAEAGLLAGDRQLARLFLLGALNWTAQWYRPGGRLPVDRIAEETTVVFLKSVP